jgi:hypothetical protein
MSKQQLMRMFPRLTETNFELVGDNPPDPTTNCVGYVLGEQGFWSPNGDEGHTWTSGIEWNVPFRDHVNSYISLFFSVGYELCGEPWAYLPEHATPEPGIDKLALYGVRPVKYI